MNAVGLYSMLCSTPQAGSSGGIRGRSVESLGRTEATPIRQASNPARRGGVPGCQLDSTTWRELVDESVLAVHARRETHARRSLQPDGR